MGWLTAYQIMFLAAIVGVMIAARLEIRRKHLAESNASTNPAPKLPGMPKSVV
jgi:hypothetical protein